MNSEKTMQLAGWFMGVVAGFLLRGSLTRGDDFFGYLSGFMMLAASLIFLLKKAVVKK